MIKDEVCDPDTEVGDCALYLGYFERDELCNTLIRLKDNTSHRNISHIILIENNIIINKVKYQS